MKNKLHEIYLKCDLTIDIQYYMKFDSTLMNFKAATFLLNLNFSWVKMSGKVFYQ